jgi:hypothetical protein
MKYSNKKLFIWILEYNNPTKFETKKEIRDDYDGVIDDILLRDRDIEIIKDKPAKLRQMTDKYNVVLRFEQLGQSCGIYDGPSGKEYVEGATVFDSLPNLVIKDMKSGRCKFILFNYDINSNLFYGYKTLQAEMERRKIPYESVTIVDSESTCYRYKDILPELKLDIFWIQWWGIACSDWISSRVDIKEFYLNTKIRPYYFLTLNQTPKVHRSFLIGELVKNYNIHKGLASIGDGDNNAISENRRNMLFTEGLYSHIKDFKGQQSNNWPWIGEYTKQNYLDSYFNITCANEWRPGKELNTGMNDGYVIQEGDDIGKRQFFVEEAIKLMDNKQKPYMTDGHPELFGGECSFGTVLTEKIWKPIANCQPFIFLGVTEELKALREMGFETFDIDESYDEEQSGRKRFNMIMKEINKLCGMPKEKIHNWYWDQWEILEHNFNHYLGDWKQKELEKYFEIYEWKD